MSIKVEHLNHIYDKGLPTEQIALEDISFEIGDNQILGIIGHTGSGKSTLLQHLNGLLKPYSGDITVDDTTITKPGISMVEIRKRVGLVFQYPEYQLFEESVKKDVAFGPKNLGLSDEEVEKRVKDAITLVGLDYEKIKDRSPFELSGGQKRAVAIAGVVAMMPKVLILDEPTAGLDPKSHDDVLDMVKKTHEKTHNTTILVSHNMSDVALICDKVLVIDSGKMVTFGTPSEVFSQGELLKSVGLEIPPITDFCNKLGIKETVLDIETAIDLITK